MLKLELGSLLSLERFSLVEKVRRRQSHLCRGFCLLVCALNLTFLSVVGTQRRVQKKAPANKEAAVAEDKRLKAAIKKFGK